LAFNGKHFVTVRNRKQFCMSIFHRGAHYTLEKNFVKQ